MQVNKPYVTGKWVTSANLRPTCRKKVSTREIKKLYSKNERTWISLWQNGKAMYRSLERSTQDTRDGFVLHSAQSSFCWPRVELAWLLRRCLVFKSSTKRKMRHFHVVVVYWRQRNFCTKKRDARAKLLFCLSYAIAFFAVVVAVVVVVAKAPQMQRKTIHRSEEFEFIKTIYFSFCSVSFVLFGRIYYIIS